MPRDAGGTYTAPDSNPVVAGTTISPDWANDTVADIGDEISDSLSRSGKGDMAVPFKALDGSRNAPGFSFQNDPSSGWYRAGTADVRLSLLGTDRVKILLNTVYAAIFSALSSTTLTLKGAVADGASAVGLILEHVNALTTSGAKLVSFCNATVEKASIDKDGKIACVGLDVGTHKVTSVVDPTSAQDAATKAYVDGGTTTISVGTQWTAGTNNVFRVGRLVTVNFVGTAGASSQWSNIGTLPSGYRPGTGNSISAYASVSDASDSNKAYPARVEIGDSGTVAVGLYDNGTSLVSIFAIGTGDAVSFTCTFATL